jgi:K+-transporting ATPase ATPase C chain
MTTLIRPAIVLFLILTVITGVVYPLAVTGVARLIFPNQAGGSLIYRDGKAVGSRLIGQSFTDPKYFWSRPSATAPQPYNGMASSGSNLGPLNPALTDAVRARIEALRAVDPANTAPIPVDLVTASASGLDPEISIAAAVRALISSHAQGRWLGVLGEPRINVLELNLAVDTLR